MKKTMALILGAALCLSLLAACGTPAADPTPTPSQEPELTGEELAAHYKEAIEAARSDEDNEYNPVYATGDEDIADLYWDILGFSAADLDAYAFALSPMNTKAYCVGVFMPVEGKADAVNAGLEKYIESMQTSFEHYLPDQGLIANNAKLETLDSGAIVLVMSDNWDAVYDSIVAAL